MKLIEISVNQTPLKAGIIPTFKGEMLFMISSNADFGGPDPSISKGHIDDGESPEEAAIREGEEELGLKKSNFASKPRLIWQDEIKGLKASYVMAIYAVEVKNKEDFGEFHYEIAETVWMTKQQFAKSGRKSQLAIVNSV
jgi:8-oxo-dGTP pyrophosphatase MutT (NUDIX family)